jgi:hypothetical protein
MTSFPPLPDSPLKAIVDRLAINDLLIRYATAIDTKNWSQLETIFTADAVLDFSSTGGEVGTLVEIMPWLEDVLSNYPILQHFISNMTISLERETARSSCYVHAVHGSLSKDGLRLFSIGGQYIDDLVHTQSGWQISNRVLMSRWMQGDVPKGFEPQLHPQL